MLYAPGLKTEEQIRAVCDAVSRPVNVLARPDLSLRRLVEAGAQRISVGGALTWVAAAATASAAIAIRDSGDFSPLAVALPARQMAETGAHAAPALTRSILGMLR